MKTDDDEQLLKFDKLGSIGCSERGSKLVRQGARQGVADVAVRLGAVGEQNAFCSFIHENIDG